MNVETDPVAYALSQRVPADCTLRAFLGAAHKMNADAEREESARTATINRLITILRDETQSSAIRAVCVSIVGER